MICYHTLGPQFRLPGHYSALGVCWRAVVLAGLILAMGTVAASADKHAAMAIDANTGKVLYNSSGNELRHPASLTKMMTLYMAFEQINAGKMNYNTTIRFSARAAAKPPSKLGIKAGESIRLIDAIKALITKSANDVACALAEHIAGSEARFAQLMTRKARAIGMKNTTFRNASGLPDPQQVTTAHDMLILAMRLQDEFPDQFKLFSTRTFAFRGKTYRNHNKLLEQVEGVDGIKTGYIRASGFNLVSSIKRDGKSVVAAVFGGKTSQARNAEMTRLLSLALKKASTKNTRKPMLVAKPKPTMRPAPPTRNPVPAGATAPRSTQPVAVAHVAQDPVPRNSPAPPPALRPTVSDYGQNRHGWQATPDLPNGARPPGTLQDQLAALLANSGVVENEIEEGSAEETRHMAAYQVPERVRPSAATGVYQVQVGAFASREEAEQRLAAIARREDSLLSNYAPVTEPIKSGSRTLYRARFSGFEQAAATSTCLALRRRQIDCFVTTQR